MRIALSLLLLAHGVAHLVGFLVPWRLLQADEVPYRTTVLSGHLDVGAVGIRVIGVLWLVTGVAFAVGAWSVWQLRPWTVPYLQVVVVTSLALSVIGWPEARLGVLVDVALLVGLLLSRLAGWS